MQDDHDAIDANDIPVPESRVSDTWPRCPECGAPRIACCPICQTAGYDFPEVDPEFAVLPDAEAAEEAMSCGCGSGCDGCAEGSSGEDASHGGDADGLDDDTPEPDAPTMLTCTTCDEPFVPDYLKRCEWCGHAFPDGFEYEPPADLPEPLNARILFVFFMLAAGVLALLGWLAYVM